MRWGGQGPCVSNRNQGRVLVGRNAKVGAALCKVSSSTAIEGLRKEAEDQGGGWQWCSSLD